MQRSTDSTVLDAIKNNNLIFISAQPDSTFFHWQVEIYLYQFAKHGIQNYCYALFGYSGSTPSIYAQNLAKKYPNIKFYKDERKYKSYKPSIRPHILAKFFKEYPNLGKYVFYHDSDIFLTKLPRFDLMLHPNDENAYLSDTISYIGYNYIKECADRYKAKYDRLDDLDIFYGMCKIIDIKPELVISNQNNSGGAQYLLKNIDDIFWVDCETKCVDLYNYLAHYERTNPIKHAIQKWTTDMWVVLWLYWKRGGTTLIHKELDFSWATGTMKEYENTNIFHLAGVTDSTCRDKFYKARFDRSMVFDAYYKNPKLFDHINKNNATYGYVQVIKEYTHNVYTRSRGITKIVEKIDNKTTTSSIPILIKKFKLNVNAPYNDIFYEDSIKKCCSRNIWRSVNGQYIMFWTGMHWILTRSAYENHIGEFCGGLISSDSYYPYDNTWNKNDVTIDLL